MSTRLMSDAEIKRRKRAQGHISQVTGGLGLAAMTGTLAASRGGRNAMRKIPALKTRIAKPPPKDPNRDRIKGAITPALATSAGLGGIGAFNFASYTNAESRKRTAMAPKKQPVKKRDELGSDELAPTFGEVTKAWTAQTKAYDPEANRARRNNIAQGTLGAAGGAGLGVAAFETGRAGHSRVAANQVRAKAPFGPITAQAHQKAKTLNRISRKQIKGAGKWAAAGAVGVGASEYVRHRKKSESWAPYAKRDTSAFGIRHD
jgi:hypothetical protein